MTLADRLIARVTRQPRLPDSASEAPDAYCPRPWNDREIDRFTRRVALFRRRGVDEASAERIADRLARRDQERDDRRLCVECKHLQRDGGCFAARQGLLDPPWVDRPMDAVRLEQAEQSRRRWRNDFRTLPTTLQRCSQFDFQVP